MPGQLIQRRPEPIPEPVRPGTRKLCDPLADWRTDAPESFPFCMACGATIRIGMRYVIVAPLTILCRPCGDPRGVLR